MAGKPRCPVCFNENIVDGICQECGAKEQPRSSRK